MKFLNCSKNATPKLFRVPWQDFLIRFLVCFDRHEQLNQKMEKTCIFYTICPHNEKKLSKSSSRFCCIDHARSLLQIEGQKDGQMMSHAIVANRLLAAKATNNDLSLMGVCSLYTMQHVQQAQPCLLSHYAQ